MRWPTEMFIPLLYFDGRPLPRRMFSQAGERSTASRSAAGQPEFLNGR